MEAKARLAEADGQGIPALAPETQPPVQAALWVQRLSLVIFVMFCVELGVLLVYLPWTSLWTDNPLLLRYPLLRNLLSQGVVRGAVSGLGVVDIGLGIWEAATYREPK